MASFVKGEARAKVAGRAGGLSSGERRRRKTLGKPKGARDRGPRRRNLPAFNLDADGAAVRPKDRHLFVRLAAQHLNGRAGGYDAFVAALAEAGLAIDEDTGGPVYLAP